ncbi:hypothetical protein MTR67_013976 [Solanum verrucosum]|uniref:Uncharacterized protein n=1 Tax=Solanum verrucosum TaxID=315347 RepID=A0AAF0QH74_SOLVR|nr:hypothetical protein MTR67_013976 [Solanum verrucosum]
MAANASCMGGKSQSHAIPGCHARMRTGHLHAQIVKEERRRHGCRHQFAIQSLNQVALPRYGSGFSRPEGK